MRLALDATGRLLPGASGRAFLPVQEAVPAELVRGPDLVGEPERIDPALLFRPPAAVPGELEDAGLAAAFHDRRAHEVGAAGACVDPNALDREFRMRVQKLVDEPDHLDARHLAREDDRRRLGSGGERNDVGLEFTGGGRLRQYLGIYRHERNIKVCFGGAERLGPKWETILADWSARANEAAWRGL